MGSGAGGGKAASGGVGGSGGSAGSGGAAGSGGTAGSGGSGGADCLEFGTFADDATPSRELHVSLTGSDTGGDGSPGAPFATVRAAARAATFGTAIRVHPGTYAGDQSISDIAGTNDSPIWIGGVPGEPRPVLSGGSQGLHLSRVRYLVLHDIEVTGATANGINIDDGGETSNDQATRHVVVRNIRVHSIGTGGNQDCLKMSGVNQFWVLESQFEDCSGGGSGIDMVGCHGGVIAQNDFNRMGSNAIQAKGGTADIIIRQNVMVNAGQRAVNMGGSTGFEYFRPPLTRSGDNFEARRVQVVANLIQGATAALAFVGCVDCVAAHNTIVNPENWILRILQETTSTSDYSFLPAQNGRFESNLIYFSRGDLSTYINVGSNTDAASFVFRSNLWYAHDSPSASQPTNLPSAETSGIYGEDPGVSAPRYETPASSRAVGAGHDPAATPADLLGRCYESPPSIGAYEPE